MKKIVFCTVLVALMIWVSGCATKVAGTPIHGLVEDRLGAFSGDGGANQDDSVKASLDLAHTDLDTGLQDFQDALGLLGIGTGNIFYVDSGTDGTAGTSWATAVGTLDEAVNLCTTNNGDIILIAPGHSETLGAGADGVDIDKHDVTVIGLGSGPTQPLFDYDTSTDEFVIAGDGVTIKNLHFHANVTSITHAIDVEAGATDFKILGCRFDVETAGTDEFVDAITIAGTASDRGLIQDCLFDMGASSNAEPDSAIHFIDCDNLQIIGNEVFGDYGDACIQNETTASNFIVIQDNVLFNGIIGGNSGLNTEPAIELVATTTGTIVNNSIACNVANPELSIVAADCYLFGNTYNEQEANSAGQIVGTRAGERYVAVKTDGTAATDDLFDVDGGPILIECFIGYVTTGIQAQACSLEITLDADSGYVDNDFTTQVELNGDVAGTAYVFTSANEAVLTPLTPGDGGTTTLMTPWFCGEGMIESGATATNTGVIAWYMVWTPLVDGVTVTVQ